jgi:hypothetical protein
MGLKIINTSYSTCFNCSDGMNSRWHPEISAKQPCYLPYGKADGTACPALSRACGKLLQLQRLCLVGAKRKSRHRGICSTLDFCNMRVIFLKAAVSAWAVDWAVGWAVWKADAAEACNAAVDNSVADGDNSCDDDNIPKTAHSQRSHRNGSWLEHRLLSPQI